NPSDCTRVRIAGHRRGVAAWLSGGGSWGHGASAARVSTRKAGTAVTAVSDPTQPRHAAAAPPAPRELLRAATTPRKLRRLLVGLVVLCLIWGAVTAWVVSQRASGAADVVSTSEPVSLDGQQIYRALSDADATAATRQTPPRRPPVWKPPRRWQATPPPPGTWRRSQRPCLSTPARWRPRG